MASAAHKYRINKRSAKNWRLIASVDIRPGESIIEETALAELSIGLLDTHDHGRFFNARNKFGGIDALERMVAELQPAEWKALRALRHGDDSIARVMETNGFDHTEQVNGQTYLIFRVYNDISRANHSCRPNAHVYWDSRTKKGVLRALQAIPANSEICIEYVASPDFTFKSGARRRAELQRHWSFECGCTACQTINGSSVCDDRERASALRLLNVIRRDQFNNGETEEQKTHRMIDLVTNRYLPVLENLGVRDARVAEAYHLLGQHHCNSFIAAKKCTTSSHCADCVSTGSIIHHLDCAINAFTSALTTYVRCYGREHSLSLDADNNLMQCIVEKAQMN